MSAGRVRTGAGEIVVMRFPLGRAPPAAERAMSCAAREFVFVRGGAGCRPRARDRLEQGARVELARVSEHLGDGPRLDDAAVLEHRDGVGDLPHEGKVVGDEEIGESELLLQLEQHLEDARLHGDIQRRCRLVEHDHIGLQHECAGDRDPLALAAGQDLTGAAGDPVATVTDDRVTGRAIDPEAGAASAIAWAEIEVELAEHGTVEVLDRIE